VQNLLLGLGTGLVAVAAVVFTAVNWDRLDATLQAAVLFGVTGLAAVATAALARRGMPATAEALGLVTVLLALADAHAVHVGALPQVDGRAYWAVALAFVAGGAWALALGTGVTSTRLAAVVLAQAPWLLLLDALDADATVAGLAALAQVALVLELAHRAKRARPEPRALAAAIATVTWLSVVGSAFVEVVFAGWFDTSTYGPAAVLAAAAAVAALVAWRRADDVAIRVLGLLAASLVGACSVVVAVDQAVSGDWRAPALGLVAAGVIGAATRVPARWGRIPAAVEGAVAALTLMPLFVAVGAAVEAAARVTGSAWDLVATSRADRFLSHPEDVAAVGPLAALLGVALLLVLAALPVLGRRAAVVGATTVGLAAVAIAPLLLPLDLRSTTLVTAVGAVLVALAGFVGGDRPGTRWGLAGAAGGLSALTVAWSTATPGLSVVGAVCVALAAAVLAVAAAARDDVQLAVPTTFTAVVAAAVAAGLGVYAAGAGGLTAVVVAGAAAVALGLVGGLLLDPTGRQGRHIEGVLAWTVEAAAWAVHGAVLAWVALQGDASAAAAVVGTGALAAGIHAARPGRRPLAGLAVAEGLAFLWLQLASAGVTTAEAYTLPLAVVLLAAGLLAERSSAARGERLESWLVLGPGLVVGFAPTVVLAFGDPGLVRPLGGLVAGALLLAAGAVAGRRAPVDIGATVVVLLGLRQLVPVVDQLPSWAVLGATGAFLLALGATFEQRRRQLHDTRARYAALR
jgi:hypothetical protein